MIRKLVLAVVVGVVVILVCTLVGSLISSIGIGTWVDAIGSFLKTFASLLGLLAALWYYFAG